MDRTNGDIDSRLDLPVSSEAELVDSTPLTDVEAAVVTDVLELLNIKLDLKKLNEEDYPALKVA